MRGIRRAVSPTVGLVLLLAACSPPLAATPTAAPTAAPKPAAAAQPTSAPAAQSGGAAATSQPVASIQPAAKPAASPATSGGAAADEVAKVKAQYYDAAKKEGKLVVYGVGNEQLWTPVKDAFQKEFPGIEVQGVDQRGRETREKILAEQQSKNYVVDVAISGPDTQQSLIDAKVTQDFTSQFIDSVIPDLRPQYASSNPRSVTIFTAAVNTNLVKPEDEPKSWNDMLDPKWKGKLELDDPRGSGPGGTILAGVEAIYGQEWSNKLAAQDLFFATQAGPMLTALARGERAIFMSSGHPDVIAQKEQGAPIKQIRPSEGVGLTPIAQSLINGAPHPNAAKLWIDWTLSEQGQQVLGDLGYGPVRQGIHPKVAEASLENTKILPRDDDKAGFESLEARTKRWTQIFFK